MLQYSTRALPEISVHNSIKPNTANINNAENSIMPTQYERTSRTQIIGKLATTCLTLVAIFCVLNPPALNAAQTDRDTLFSQRVQTAVDEHVMPRLKQLVSSTRSLSRAVKNACTTGSIDAWDETRFRFEAAVLSWAGVAHLRFGPFELLARARRLSFHPDPRGIVWRQLRRALAKSDPALLELGTLAKQSIALQGLTALELLLANPITVGKNATPVDVYKCAFASAVAANVFTTSQDALAEWSKRGGWRERLLSPAETNKFYETQTESITELAKSALLGFQIIRDQQIGIIRKTMLGLTKLSQLPYYRSHLSDPYLRASIDGVCELFEKLDLVTLVPDKKISLKGTASKTCRDLRQTSKALIVPYANDDFPGKLTDAVVLKLYRSSNKMRLIIGRDIAPTVGLTMGFNSLDGD
ncbi:MAG: imelysin family protein [Hyphomicrobiaceae bacterium]